MMPKKAISTRLRLGHSAKLSRSGALVNSPLAFKAAKAGLSDNLTRIQTDTASSSTETRNGTRQPQSRKAGSPTAVRVPRMTSNPAMRPSEAVTWIQPVSAPRRRSGACSAT